LKKHIQAAHEDIELFTTSSTGGRPSKEAEELALGMSLLTS
jgi:hypothetical protein